MTALFLFGVLTGAAATIFAALVVIARAIGPVREPEWVDEDGRRPHRADGSTADVAPFHEATNA